MAIQKLSQRPNEGGTAIITVVPTDEDDTVLEFADLTSPQWELMQTNGTIIPGCAFGDNVMTSLTWIISGDQLAMFNDSGWRILTFTATYNSDIGNNLPIHVACMFKIQPLSSITDL